MPLADGEHLGPYQILELIGSGGMGEVYRARDTRLGREVAVKISGAQFSERFAREAHLIASLNHPNICTLHDVGPNYLVMELVDGPTLADRQNPMPLAEAISVALQIAEALEAAHEKGIIHRDLKPANIKLTSEGKVKVLDFGLAKAMERDASSAIDPVHSPTIVAATHSGIILGTAAYMAPEQARGHAVDRRADVWAFGVVLWELLTGRRMFDGDTVSDTLAQVLTKEPEIDAAPASMRPLLKRCLERDRKLRLQAIGEARILLANPRAASEARLPAKLPWAVAAVATIALAVALWAPWRATGTVERPFTSFRVDLEVEPPPDPLGAHAILSPDGRRIVFRDSTGQLWTRRFDHDEASLLPGTERAYSPFFSPDGRWVGFNQAGKLKKISVEGGSAITLCDAPQLRGASWGDDGNIIAALDVTGGLSRIAASGGKPAPVTGLDPKRNDRTHRFPYLLPGGKAVLFTVSTTNQYDDATIELQRLDGGGRKTIHHGGSFARYIPTDSTGSTEPRLSRSGYIVYYNRGTVFALPFDVARLEVTGPPTPLLEGVAGGSGAAQFDFSRDGKFIYRGGASVQFRVSTIQWLDGSGKTEPLLGKPGSYFEPRLSPDGQRLALRQDANIWVYEWKRDTMTKLTFGSIDSSPVWSPEGRHIVFRSEASSIFAIRADGSGKAQRLLEGANQRPYSFTPDGKRLAFTSSDGRTGIDIWTVPIEEQAGVLHAGKPEPYLRTPFVEVYAAFSPDGKWMAYASNESGTMEVYVRAFPDTGGKWQISNGGGMMPVWSRNGKELFYRTLRESRIMVSSYKTQGGAFVADKPHLWSEKRFAPSPNAPNFDLAPDGKRFVVLVSPEQSGQEKPDTHVTILLNFFEEVKRRVAAGGKQ